MSKYKKHFQDMLEENTDVFATFKDVHGRYDSAPDDVREEFNTEGNKVLRIVRRYENSLCARSEGGKYGKFSAGLSEKFWEEVRGYFPKIDEVVLE